MTALLGRALTGVTLLGGLSLAGTAMASAAPVAPADFTCGMTVFTACNQTAHFSTPSGTDQPEFGTPSPAATNCPAYIQTDAVEITGTGNGVEHAIINNKGDAWFTSTFTGQVTLVPFTADAMGNPIAPDPAAPTLTGHLTQWFGGSFNNKNFVNHDTITFVGTGSDGSQVSFHMVDHQSVSATVGAAPMSFTIAHC
jgi:hypothetical protein